MSKATDDNDLLARLNALKPSSVNLNGQHDTSTNGDDLIAARFLKFQTAGTARQFKGKPEGPDTEDAIRNPEDDQTIEELLADIGPDDQWTLDPNEPKHIAKLMGEAKASLKNNITDSKDADAGEDLGDLQSATKASEDLVDEVSAESEEGLREAQDLRTAALTPASSGNEKTQDDIQDEEADAALQRILDELSLENALVDHDLPSKQQTEVEVSDSSSQDKTTSEGLETVLNLPATPDRHPSVQAQNTGFDLPSAPTSKPSQKVVKSNLPVYTNQEIDTWCVICNDDATILCSGCDGDLYCQKCWKEGHMGPDAGYEEKMHRWSKYSKPR